MAAVTSVGAISLEMQLDQKNYKKGLDSAKKTGNAWAGKMAGIFAAAFSVAAVTKFASACLDLASDLNEVQNVVNVTFGTMAGKVDTFAKAAANSFGLSETMAKQYVGTFGSMADAFGFTEQEAYNMATSLTALSGDVASFYNLTQDEAFTKLKSVFTGETEALKSLGVVMTQSALDAFALANGFGKTTAKMSEAEKVALRYVFVQNQLSNATGDFARTSGGWANQVRILKLQFDSLKATIGQGLINALTPVLQLLNKLLGYLTKAAEKFKELTEAIFGASDASESIASTGMQATADAAESTAESLKEASRYMAGFDEMNTVQAPDTQSGATGSTTAPSIGGIDTTALAEAGTQADKFGGIIDTVGEKLSVFKAGALSVFETVKGSVIAMGNTLKTIWDNVYNTVVVPVAEFLGVVIQDSINGLVNFWNEKGALIFGSIENYMNEAGETIQSVWDTIINPVFGAFMGVITKLWKEHLLPLFTNVLNTGGDLLASTVNAISWLMVCIDEFVTYFKPEIEKVVGVINWLVAKAGDGVGVISDALNGLITFVKNVFTGNWSAAWAQVRAVFGSVGSFINGVWISIKSALSGIPGWFKSQFDGAVQMIKSAFSGIANWFKNTFATAWENVKKVFTKGGAVFKDIKDGILDSLKGVINGLIGGINKVIAVPFNGLNEAFNKLRGINILGAKPFAGLPSFGVPQIPKLAQGGFVEANTPRLAIIGDNKREGEIVSPESKLQAMADAAAGANAAQLSQILSTLQALVSICEQGSDTVLYLGNEQVARANAKGAALLKRRYNTSEIIID